ncbi:PREDICTED: stabilin-1-like [Capra hircus]|uniref:stabilin-1-like n=1 Tax=Capra hircus TaxID=9925 RepID=UPI0008478C47|nr:PREDICTED: stabilin-1-like [Capra hircus]
MCELGRYGPNCTGVCDCAHGLCQEGLRGDGSCICNVGWQGLRCDQKISGPQCLQKCDPNANCVQDSAAAPACVCAAGYSGDGVSCSAVDPCARDHGGCSPHANCTTVAPGQRTCTCLDGYMGDGELCQEANSCLIRHGGCHMHAECIPTGPQQVRQLGEPHTGDGPSPAGWGAPQTRPSELRASVPQPRPVNPRWGPGAGPSLEAGLRTAVWDAGHDGHGLEPGQRGTQVRSGRAAAAHAS